MPSRRSSARRPDARELQQLRRIDRHRRTRSPRAARARSCRSPRGGSARRPRAGPRTGSGSRARECALRDWRGAWPAAGRRWRRCSGGPLPTVMSMRAEALLLEAVHVGGAAGSPPARAASSHAACSGLAERAVARLRACRRAPRYWLPPAGMRLGAPEVRQHVAIAPAARALAPPSARNRADCRACTPGR